MLGLLVPADLSQRADITDLGEEHGHRVARVRQRHQGRPRPAAYSGRPSIDRAIGTRTSGPIL
jgi:hypothetical protein